MNGRTFPRVLLAAMALGALGAGVWWLGPWSKPFRYRHTKLVPLWRTAQADPKDFLAWRELGLRLAKDGDPLAERPLREAFNLKPQDRDVATALGELLLANRNYGEAFQVLQTAVNNHPDFVPPRLVLGRLYRRRGSFQNASEQFQAVVKLDPKQDSAWYELARCYLEMQQSEPAKDAIGKATSLDPKDGRYMALRGSIATATGDVDSGIRDTREASRLAPGDAQIQVTLANLLLANHRNPEDLEEAGKVIETVAKIAPTYPLLEHQRGELARLQGDWKRATEHFLKAVQAAPEQDEVYFSLSQALRRTGRGKEADRALGIYRQRQSVRTELERARIELSQNQEDPDRFLKLAELQFRLNDREGAKGSLEAALRLRPNDPKARARLNALVGPPPSSASPAP